MLWPLLLVGVSSVVYWAYSESIGAGDLRFYGMVQFLPLLLIPMILYLFPTRNYKACYVWMVIGGYVLAKVFELLDSPLYELLGMSGHSLKHIAAALSGIAFFYAIKSIQPDLDLHLDVNDQKDEDA